MTGQHSKGAPDQEWTTTETFDSPERYWGGADINESGDKRDQKGVLYRIQIGEKTRSEVKNEVNSCPLLHHLQRSAQDRAAEVATWFPDGTFEAIRPRGKVGTL